MGEEEFLERLKSRLTRPLPGTVAHDQMKARLPEGGRIDFQERPGKREGGVLILFYQHEDRWMFPVIRRAQYDGVHGGQIGLPGGKREKEDHDLFHTAIREAEEEIGIQGSDVSVLGNLSSFFVGASNYQVLPVVGHIKYKPSFIPDEKEVDEVIEVELDHFLKPNNRKEKEITIRERSLIAPYFDVSSQFIWGATAMMLSELVSVIEDI